jgi:hypothetical protein
MNVSPEEAREALATIRQVTAQTNKASAVGSAPFLLVWGLVWIIGFLASQFISSSTIVGGIWGGLTVVGVAASAAQGVRLGRQVRTASGARIAAFFWALLGYTALCLWIVRPLAGAQLALLIVLAIMFGYVVLGLWLGVAPLVGFGLVEGTLALLGYYVLPAYFALWMAVVGGGALLGSGIYLLCQGKRSCAS